MKKKRKSMSIQEATTHYPKATKTGVRRRKVAFKIAFKSLEVLLVIVELFKGIREIFSL